MVDWRIKDNKIICYNLCNKLMPFTVGMKDIEKAVDIVKKQNECDDLEATIIMKKKLKQKVAEHESKTK